MQYKLNEMMDFKIFQNRDKKEIIEMLSKYPSYDIISSDSDNDADKEKKKQMAKEKFALIISLLYLHYDKQTQKICFYSYVNSGEDELAKNIRVEKVYNPLSENSYSIIMDYEVRSYAFNICNTLANLDLSIISYDSPLVRMYDEITTIIENSRLKAGNHVENNASFLIKTEFWELYFRFHDRYYQIEETMKKGR